LVTVYTILFLQHIPEAHGCGVIAVSEELLFLSHLILKEEKKKEAGRNTAAAPKPCISRGNDDMNEVASDPQLPSVCYPK
jgi:hypothetical protein